MSHYYADIKAAIKTIILTSTNVRNVYDYEEVKPAGFPAITVTPSAGAATFLDTMRTERSFEFTIRCYQERLEVGASAAESIMTALVDELISIFELPANSNLGNTVVFAKPVSVKWGYLTTPNPDVRSAEISIIAEAAQ